jgi:hypothetical protein
MFALLAILLVGGAGIGFDYMRWGQQRAALQEAADSGAIAGAVELGLGGLNLAARVTDKAERVSRMNQSADLSVAAPLVSIDQADHTVTVSMSMPAKKTLSAILIRQDTTISATSTAEVIDKTVACIFALNATASPGLDGNGSAIVQGTNCAIQVNSDAPDALTNSGTISASHICVAGGYTGSGYSPAPETGCAQVGDPFVSTIVPAPGACTSTDLSINSSTTLGPGVYCGGIQIAGGATVSLAPGEYHIVDGALKMTSGASIAGADVVFVLSGTATLSIAGSGEVLTTPPISGPLTGFSIVQDRNAPLGLLSKITGEGRFEFPGIVYLPRSKLDVAGRAAGNVYIPTYAAIVADTIKVSGQGELSATADTASLGKNAAATLTVVNTRLIK